MRFDPFGRVLAAEKRGPDGLCEFLILLTDELADQSYHHAD